MLFFYTAELDNSFEDTLLYLREVLLNEVKDFASAKHAVNYDFMSKTGVR